MARYESRYTKLGFYVNDVFKHFINGVYETEDKEEIAVLDSMPDAVRVEEEKPQPKTEAKPKSTTRKKVSAE